MEPEALKREQMVQRQLEQRGVRDPRVLAAMRSVPRHLFVSPQQLQKAYADEPLPIGEGQTVSQPYIVARMLEAAGIASCDRVLEVGTGSGYSAAVASLLGRDVFTLERHETLAVEAEERLARLGYLNVVVRHADGTLGWLEQAPFDAVLVPAAPREIPVPLLEQLAIGGRLVIPVGPASYQRLLRIVRTDENDYQQQPLEAVHFVPLLPGVTGGHPP